MATGPIYFHHHYLNRLMSVRIMALWHVCSLSFNYLEERKTYGYLCVFLYKFSGNYPTDS